MKLSILILTIVGREAQYESLVRSLSDQYTGTDVQICTSKDNKENSIGKKRNELLEMAIGDYLCFIDDDDRVSKNYIKLLMEGIDKGVDCCSLVGEITFDGKNPKPFIHSIKHDRYWEDERAYYRFPNHLNCVKSEIAKQFTFPLKNFSEDTEWAVKVHESGLIKIEHEINETIYYYDFKPNK